MAMIDVIRADEMSRLGICADDDCEGVVLDLSRNRSRRFCSTACGNRARSRPTAPGSGVDCSGVNVEEAAQHLQEDLGLLGVHPVPGALDRHPPVAGEPAVHRLGVLLAHVVGAVAAHPEHRTVVGRRRPRAAPRASRPARSSSSPRTSRLTCHRQSSPSRRRFCSRKLRTVSLGTASRSCSSASLRRSSAARSSPLHRLDVRRRTPACCRRSPARRPRRTAARPARGAAAPAPSRSCRPSSARPASRVVGGEQPAPPGRRGRGSRSGRSTPTARGWACPPGAPGGSRPAACRSGSSSALPEEAVAERDGGAGLPELGDVEVWIRHGSSVSARQRVTITARGALRGHPPHATKDTTHVSPSHPTGRAHLRRRRRARLRPGHHRVRPRRDSRPAAGSGWTGCWPPTPTPPEASPRSPPCRRRPGERAARPRPGRPADAAAAAGPGAGAGVRAHRRPSAAGSPRRLPGREAGATTTPRRPTSCRPRPGRPSGCARRDSPARASRSASSTRAATGPTRTSPTTSSTT